MKGRVLILAGSDPSGGAGVQADIKTVTALGGYGASAITALTVQNTRGVSAVHAVSPDIIAAQFIAAIEDIGADAIKIGMIGEVAAAEKIDQLLEDYSGPPVVLDPVLVATSGDALAADGVAAVIKSALIARAALITPNIPEAEALTGVKIVNRDNMIAAGRALIGLGAKAALVTGGHLKGPNVEDVLVTQEGARIFSNPRLETRATHGTGCTLASATATGLAQKMALPAAVKRAIDYVQMAIKTAPGLGAGAGPVNHAHPCCRDENDR